MNQNLTEIIFILDRSGSMWGIKEDAIGGFNSMMEEQRKIDGDANVTLVLFDHEVEFVSDGVDINEVKDLTNETYVPDGLTAMYDAVGLAVSRVGKRLSETPENERPAKVIVAVMTDGMENASKEYTSNRVQEMVKHQTDVYSWQFMFLGANIDSVSTAKTIGIKGSLAGNFTASSDGVSSAYMRTNSMMSSYRSTGEMPEMKDEASASASETTTLVGDNGEETIVPLNSGRTIGEALKGILPRIQKALDKEEKE